MYPHLVQDAFEHFHSVVVGFPRCSEIKISSLSLSNLLYLLLQFFPRWCFQYNSNAIDSRGSCLLIVFLHIRIKNRRILPSLRCYTLSIHGFQTVWPWLQSLGTCL